MAVVMVVLTVKVENVIMVEVEEEAVEVEEEDGGKAADIGAWLRVTS